MLKCELRVVASSDEPRRAMSPETRLKQLFRKEARLERELIGARREIAAARARYARKHLLLMLPSIDHLRRLFA